MDILESTEFVNAPDGIYDGYYGGWEVKFKNEELTGFRFRVNKGVRTMRVPVKILVKFNFAYVIVPDKI